MHTETKKRIKIITKLITFDLGLVELIIYTEKHPLNNRVECSPFIEAKSHTAKVSPVQ